MSLWYVGRRFSIYDGRDRRIMVYDTDDCTLERVSCRQALAAGFDINGVIEYEGSLQGSEHKLRMAKFVVWNDIATMLKDEFSYEICTVDGRYYFVTFDASGLYVNDYLIDDKGAYSCILLLGDGVWVFHNGSKVLKVDLLNSDVHMNVHTFQKKLLLGGS